MRDQSTVGRVRGRKRRERNIADAEMTHESRVKVLFMDACCRAYVLSSCPMGSHESPSNAHTQGEQRIADRARPREWNHAETHRITSLVTVPNRYVLAKHGLITRRASDTSSKITGGRLLTHKTVKQSEIQKPTVALGERKAEPSPRIHHRVHTSFFHT